jgi:hypothetical protein
MDRGEAERGLREHFTADPGDVIAARAQRVLRPAAAAAALPRRCGAGRLTDAELLAKRLAFIETRLSELRRLARPAEIERDLRELRFAEHTLRIAIQAALDAMRARL